MIFILNDRLRHLGFLIFYFFLNHKVQKANVYQHSKFHQNQSNGF